MMTSKARLVAFAATLGIALLSFDASSQTGGDSAKEPTKEAKDEASSRFRKGFELFKEGDYQAALIEFRRAYELAPNYNVLYNIAQVYFQLQDYANALTKFEQYLSEGGRNVPKARREEVEKEIEKLRARVANIEITSAVADVEVALDDVPQGKTPLGKAVMVSAGRHKISASKEGYRPYLKIIEVASADSVKVALDMVELKAGTPEPQPTSTQVVVTPPSPTTTATVPVAPLKPPVEPPSIPWAGWAVTGGLAAGAVITGVLALSSSSDLVEKRNGFSTRDELSKAASDVSTKALVSDILTGCAVVAGGVTLIFTVRAVSASGASSDTAAPAGAPSAQSGIKDLRVGLGVGKVELSGSF